MPETGSHNLSPSHAKHRLLPAAEWLAENAYIAPGFHRLLTVLGLSAGLWTGRQLMDVITAHSASENKELKRDNVPEILRPLYGIMRYNPYSDAPADRWKGVLDAIGPVMVGSFGAYLGSKHFFDGAFRGKRFHGLSASVEKQLRDQNGKITLDVAESMMSKHQADALNKLATSTLVVGSAAGSHLAGALAPLNNGMVAARFQLGNLRNINLPLPRAIRRPIEKLLGNNGETSRRLVPALRDWVKWAEANIAHNPNMDWRNEREIMHRASDLLQQFPTLSAAERNAFYKECNTLLDSLAAHAKTLQHQGKTVADIEKAIHSMAHKEITGEALEKLYLRAGIDITKAEHPNFGPFTALSRWFGSGNKETETLQKLHKHWRDDLKLDTNGLATSVQTKRSASAMAVGATALTLASGAGFTLTALQEKNSRETQRIEQNTIDKKNNNQQYNIVDWLNSKPLDAAQWISRVLVIPPSMHRFMSAAYLSGTLWAGLKLADAMTGRHLPLIRAGDSTKSLVTKESMATWNPLRLVHGTLSYTPGLSTFRDRWRMAAHHLIPVALGTLGTTLGSKMFFRDREKHLQNPEYIEDYTDKISFEQSRPFGWLTGITSIFNTGSGIHILPMFSYSANLHDRYLLASGQQVAMPVLGQWWSGNPGTLPWGVKKTLRHTINYLTENPEQHPRELPELVRSVIAKLYPTLGQEELALKEAALIRRIDEVRAPFLHEGKVMPSKKTQLKEALSDRLTKSGLEILLKEIGLDPLKADLAHNGFSGRIANFLGEAKHVERLSEEYRQKASERLKTPANDRQPNPQASESFQSKVVNERAKHLEDREKLAI